MRHLLFGALLAAVAGGCARDVHARFPGVTDGSPTASLVLRFTDPVEHAHVSVNGVPVASDVHTREIVVEGIPPGETSILLAASNTPEKAFVLDLQPGQRAVVPLSAPSASFGKSLLQAAVGAAVYATYLALTAAI